eukprot:CAMPEP_0185762718 /NCGR_PEP_ID=MMETSP1174-20130828/21676_1 /TAXON_ID=35687 /ORGANISM="Dictyocha speculum, Strain CCMP1381" /LENGTH=233 /DNA_ID=CAMNT_0028444503 /DNA_START=600 /DNA_END=1301 /DNA_ORIENTATION=+
MSLNAVTWPSFQDVSQVSDAQKKCGETSSVIFECKKLTKKVDQGEELITREKRLYAKFKYDSGCLIVKPGVQMFRGKKFYVPGMTGALWVPSGSFELKERILTWYINLLSTGVSLQKIGNETESDGEMVDVSPAEKQIRISFFWPELIEDFRIERDRQELLQQDRKAEQYKLKAQYKSTFQQLSRLWTIKRKKGDNKQDKKEMKKRRQLESDTYTNVDIYHGAFNDPEETELE